MAEYIPMNIGVTHLQLYVTDVLHKLGIEYQMKLITNGVMVMFQKNLFTFDVVFALSLDETREVIEIVPDPDWNAENGNVWESHHCHSLTRLATEISRFPH